MNISKLLMAFTVILAMGCNKKDPPAYSDTGMDYYGTSSTCSDLQAYYDDCCYTCGSGDSYCGFSSASTEAECQDELQGWLSEGFELYGTCYCDG